jgi:predicted DNA-binding helix-hairpin-helix protein
LKNPFQNTTVPKWVRIPSPFQFMVPLLSLKQLCNRSDDNLVTALSENLYNQYFIRDHYFAAKEPCSLTELLEFRKTDLVYSMNQFNVVKI